MDIDFLLMLQNLRDSAQPGLTELIRSVSIFTDAELLIVLIGIIYWCISKKVATYLLASLVVSRIINGFLKITFCQYRPWIIDSRLHPTEVDMKDATGYSFPSGHASNGTVFYGGIAFRKNVKLVFKIAAVLLVLLVCFSRTYLSVHTPEDVLVGVLVGVVSLVGTTFFMNYIEKHPNKDILVCIIGVCVCVILALYASIKQFPVDYGADGNILVDPNSMIKDCFRNVGFGLGFFIGWVLERRFVKFDTHCSIPKRIARFVVCLGIYFLISYLDSLFITKETFGIYVLGVGNFAVTFYIAFIAPVIIKFIDYLFRKVAAIKAS